MLSGHDLMSQIRAAEEEETNYKCQQRNGGNNQERPHEFPPGRKI